jgi:thiol-disulfide isomerase/thioredoxin
MKRRKHLLATALLLCATLASAAPKKVPNLEAKSLTGESEKITALRGSIVVISFWATWCGPCTEELPRLSKLKQEYAAKGVRFIAISVDEPKTRAKIEPYLKQQSIELEVWVGGNLDMLEHSGLGNVLPGTLIIDQQGEIVTRIVGEAQEPDIRSRLDWLTNERPGPAPEPLIKHY